MNLSLLRKARGQRLALRSAWFVVCVLCLSVAAGCKGKPPSEEQRTILRLNGSRVMGMELAPLLAGAFLMKKGGTGVTRVTGPQGEIIVRAFLPGLQAQQAIEIRATDSDGAFEALRQGFSDVGMSTRPVTRRERDAIAKIGLGDVGSPSNEHRIGVDSIAIIVSHRNRVISLTREQVSHIFSGAITDWSQVNAAMGGKITIYLGDEQKASYQSITEIVGEYGAPGPKLSPHTLRFADERELSDSVARDPQGIGAVKIPYIGSANSVAVVGKDGMSYHPNLINVRAGNYPLSRPLFLYTPSTPEGSLSSEFVAFCLSPEGQDLIQKAGFIRAADLGHPRQP
ncbi:MAG: substrate-binding domain-containing protein [Chloroflexota bacterium]